MGRGKKTALIVFGVVIALAAIAGVYYFLPTAPKTIEGVWVSEDGMVVFDYKAGLARSYMAAQYAENTLPFQTFSYIVTDNMMRVFGGKEANGEDVSLPPYTAEMRFAFGNRVVTMFDSDVRMNSFYRWGSPEARLLLLTNNWYK